MSVSAAHKPKAPEQTRRDLLAAAYDEIHRVGFQAASLSRILATAGVTKGALYHHFVDKHALGIAVIDEVIAPEMRRFWLAPLESGGPDPIATMIRILRAADAEMSDQDLALGCPLNNLAQEMSPVDDDFRVHLNVIYDQWREVLANALRLGQETGQVGAKVQVDAAATFIVAALEGCIGMAKNSRSREVLSACGEGIISYLQSLRA